MHLSKIILFSFYSLIVCVPTVQAVGEMPVEAIVLEHKINLTAEESDWIAQNKKINAAVKTGWMPIEYKIESESSRGISVDYLKQITALTGLKFNIINYIDVFDPSDVHLVTGLLGKTELDNYTKIYSPHLYIPYAIYVNKYVKSNYRSVTLEDLSVAKVAIYKDAPIGKELKKMYPDMELIYVDIADDAFEFLENKLIDAYIGNELVIDYHVEFHRLQFAKKTSTINFESLVFMAVRNDQEILNSIVSKSLAKIGPNNTKILNYWKKPASPLESLYKLLLTLLFLAFITAIYKLLAIRRKSKQESLQNQKMIWNQANYDRQTNLPNRNFFERKIKEVINDTKQNKIK